VQFLICLNQADKFMIWTLLEQSAYKDETSVGCGTHTHRRGKKSHMLAGKPGEKRTLGRPMHRSRSKKGIACRVQTGFSYRDQWVQVFEFSYRDQWLQVFEFSYRDQWAQVFEFSYRDQWLQVFEFSYRGQWLQVFEFSYRDQRVHVSGFSYSGAGVWIQL